MVWHCKVVTDILMFCELLLHTNFQRYMEKLFPGTSFCPCGNIHDIPHVIFVFFIIIVGVHLGYVPAVVASTDIIFLLDMCVPTPAASLRSFLPLRIAFLM